MLLCRPQRRPLPEQQSGPPWRAGFPGRQVPGRRGSAQRGRAALRGARLVGLSVLLDTRPGGPGVGKGQRKCRKAVAWPWCSGRAAELGGGVRDAQAPRQRAMGRPCQLRPPGRSPPGRAACRGAPRGGSARGAAIESIGGRARARAPGGARERRSASSGVLVLKGSSALAPPDLGGRRPPRRLGDWLSRRASAEGDIRNVAPLLPWRRQRDAPARARPEGAARNESTGPGLRRRGLAWCHQRRARQAHGPGVAPPAAAGAASRALLRAGGCVQTRGAQAGAGLAGVCPAICTQEMGFYAMVLSPPSAHASSARPRQRLPGEELHGARAACTRGLGGAAACGRWRSRAWRGRCGPL